MAAGAGARGRAAGARAGARAGAAGAAGGRASFAVALPGSEGELLAQVQTCVAAALADGLPLLEVEAPLLSGLGVNCGDSIAISEYNANQQLLRRFARHWEDLGTAESVRVFFPDAAEASIALNGAGVNPASGQWEQAPTFHDWPGQVDYLMRDDLFSRQSRRSQGLAELPAGLTGKARVDETAEVADRLYLVGYPYDSSDELAQVMRLWEAHARPTVIFNGELDKVRAGFALPFTAEARLKAEFLPQVETAYYLHLFKGSTPGALVRAYPGPWRALRPMEGGGFECVREFEERPELRSVALEYFCGALRTAAVAESSAPREELSDDNQRYYELLGVARDAVPRDVQMAYRLRARELHPDQGGDPLQFYELSKAYAVLRDPETRALYDRWGERWVDVGAGAG